MMKTIIYTLLGIIGTVIIALIFNYIFGVKLQSFALFFILPIGGLYVGIGGALGLFYRYFSGKKSITYKQYIIALILAFITFYTLYYFSYIIFDDQSNTFKQYLELEKSSGEILLGFRGAVSTTSVNTGKIINTISFYLQLFGSFVGAIGIGMYFHMKLDENK